ncbi:MAG TPA: methylated-DNA--[protein]-cysteine S-methyltransferase [Dermatophilaceae bacterium]|nr:methylated-DNA--[protein]-cysteine S-methyltransferase [Dermatophilaceae bacterium]
MTTAHDPAAALASFDPPLRPPLLPDGDVAYTTEETAVGRLLLAATDGALVTLAYAPDAAAEDAWLVRLADAVSPRVLRAARPLDAARRELTAYLAGRRTRFEVPTDLRLAGAFQREVLAGLVARVGYGRRTTYAALAADLDHPRAARAVGSALARNPLCIVLPCHRVLPAAGGVGGYAGGAAAKEHLLALEAGHRPGG